MTRLGQGALKPTVDSLREFTQKSLSLAKDKTPLVVRLP